LFKKDLVRDESVKRDNHGSFVVNNDVENLVNEMINEWMEEDRVRGKNNDVQINNNDVDGLRSQNNFVANSSERDAGICNNPFFARIILFIYYMCLCLFNYLFVCLIWD